MYGIYILTLFGGSLPGQDPDPIFERFWHNLDSILGASGPLFRRPGGVFLAFPVFFRGFPGPPKISGPAGESGN